MPPSSCHTNGGGEVSHELRDEIGHWCTYSLHTMKDHNDGSNTSHDRAILVVVTHKNEGDNGDVLVGTIQRYRTMSTFRVLYVPPLASFWLG